MSVSFNVAPTQPQLDYIESIRKRLHLPEHMLDGHCVQRFGKPFKSLTKTDASALLDEMIAWEALPRDMQIAMGQRELF